MDEQLVDFNFLEEISAGDPKYKYDVLDIFIGSVEEGLAKLEKLVEEMKDFEAIYKQAHSLKSPSGIVHVKDMHPRLAKVEDLARAVFEKKMKAPEATGEINELVHNISITYAQALSLLTAEREKYKPKE